MLKKIILDKIAAQWNIFIGVQNCSACAVIVHTRADQFVLQLMMNQFDSLPSQ